MNIIDPATTPEVDEWMDYTSDELSSFGILVVPIPGAPWSDWANSVLNVPRVASLNCPKPEFYGDDWRRWADDFNLVVSIL